MSPAPIFDASLIDGDILVLVVRGKLDSVSTPEFERLVHDHLEAGRTKIIIDCRYLMYVSSLGLGALVALQTRLRRRGGTVKLSSVFGPTMEVIRAVRLDKMLEIYGDQEFARKSFSSNETAANETARGE